MQIQIWKCAASPVGVLPLSELFFKFMRPVRLRDFFRSASTNKLVFRTVKYDHLSNRTSSNAAEKFLTLYSEATQTSMARTALLGTCRLTRQVVLELWRKDVEATEIVEISLDYNVDLLDHMVEAKRQFVDCLDEPIEYVLLSSCGWCTRLIWCRDLTGESA